MNGISQHAADIGFIILTSAIGISILIVVSIWAYDWKKEIDRG